jgi:predicted RND superfamily exporter protein
MLEALSRRITNIALPLLILALCFAVLGGYFGSDIKVNMGFRETVPNELHSMQSMEWVEDNLGINLTEASPIIVLVQADNIQASMMQIGPLWAELEALNGVRSIRPEYPQEDAPAYGQAMLTHLYLTEPLNTVELRDEVLSDVDGVLAKYNGLDLETMGLSVVLEEIQEELPWEQVKIVLLTLAGLVAVLALGFRRLTAPLIILCTLGMAMAWTLGIMRAFGITVTVVTMAVFPLFLGLGIDYCIHFLRRYDEERKQGQPVPKCIATSFSTTGGAILIASITSIVAFVILATSWFVGLRDLGLSLAFGTALAAFAAFTVLPSFIAIRERSRAG